jgi:hypothetical protein
MTSFIKRGLEGVVVLVLACSANGSLVTDPYGMNGGSPGQWQNTVRFESSPKRVSVNVEYCVYAPGQFGLSFSGEDPTGGTDYVYAYQIFNTVSPHPYPSDKAPVRSFSVGVDQVKDQVANLSYLVDDPNHKYPTGVVLGLDSARWNFEDPNDVEYGYVSDILFYTSPFAPYTTLDPNKHKATVRGPSIYLKTIVDVLPTPAPEPATVGLLGAGLFVLTQRARRKKG